MYLLKLCYSKLSTQVDIATQRTQVRQHSRIAALPLTKVGIAALLLVKVGIAALPLAEVCSILGHGIDG